MFCFIFSTTALTGFSINEERKLMRKGLVKLISDNSTKYAKIKLDDSDLRKIKELVKKYESKIYTKFLNSYNVSNCNTKIGKPDLFSIDINHFKRNSTSFVDESNGELLEPLHLNSSPFSPTAYRNLFSAYTQEIYSFFYSPQHEKLQLLNESLIYTIYIDHPEDPEAQLSLADGDIDNVSQRFTKLHTPGVNYITLNGENIESTIQVVLPSLDRDASNKEKVFTELNIQNPYKITDSFGNRCLVSIELFDVEIFVPEDWIQIQSHFIFAKNILDSFIINNPLNFEHPNIKFSSAFKIQNIFQLFDHALLYLDEESDSIKENLFLSLSIPMKSVIVGKKAILELCENLKAPSREGLVKLDTLKKKIQIEKIDFSSQVALLLNTLNKDPSLMEKTCKELDLLKFKVIEEKNKAVNLLNNTVDDDQLREVVSSRINYYRAFIKELSTMVGFFRRTADKSTLSVHVNALKEKYDDIFENAEKNLSELKKTKRLLPALKAEGSFNKADSYAYSQNTGDKELALIYVKYRKSLTLENQSERYILENFETFLKANPEVDCVINKDENGHLTYYLKDENQAMVNIVFTYAKLPVLVAPH